MSVNFDETNLVPNAGLVDRRLHLTKHGANSGAKALSVIGSMLAGQEPGHFARRGPVG